MANNQNGIGVQQRYISSLLFTGVAIIFWAVVNVLDIVAPSPALDTIKILAYLAIAFSGVTIIIDVLLVRYKKKRL